MKENNFSVNMFSICDPSNGGYHESTHQATMLIVKDGVQIILNSEEIREVVKEAGGNFKC